ncbi:hypothetical protein [Tateyamaria sp. ANG-S1]|uniref:hypothetical protein n=1 Tax=Tateyamaria sp. ANG-S1 TaxID=1577905 RepID=UPI00126A2603|nr:hypothetical protein [Tateyamaria sp. ANG-S1]
MSSDKPVIRLLCTSDDGAIADRAASDLCRQLVQALAPLLPGANFRQVRMGEWAPIRLSDASVAVDIAHKFATLTWQLGNQRQIRHRVPFKATFGNHADPIRQDAGAALSATTPELITTLRAHLGIE